MCYGQDVIECVDIIRDFKMHEEYNLLDHDDVIKWKIFPRNWSFVRGIHRSRWIPHTKASDAELWCFLDMRLNKRLSKHWWGWWFETPSWSLWRQCNDKMFFAYCVLDCVAAWMLLCSKLQSMISQNGFPIEGCYIIANYVYPLWLIVTSYDVRFLSQHWFR